MPVNVYDPASLGWLATRRSALLTAEEQYRLREWRDATDDPHVRQFIVDLLATAPAVP